MKSKLYLLKSFVKSINKSMNTVTVIIGEYDNNKVSKDYLMNLIEEFKKNPEPNVRYDIFDSNVDSLTVNHN